jgi:hypothetical protein
MSDALGQDQFQPVNRRAGYGDALEMALSAARKGWTLSAGQGLLIVEHYEEKLAAERKALPPEDAERFVCLAHHHTNRWEEALCSAKYQLDEAREDAARWRFFCNPQTALMLGSKCDPNDDSIDWRAEINRLADERTAALTQRDA